MRVRRRRSTGRARASLHEQTGSGGIAAGRAIRDGIGAERRQPGDQLLEPAAPARDVGADDQHRLAAREQVAGDAGDALAAAVAHARAAGARAARAARAPRSRPRRPRRRRRRPAPARAARPARARTPPRSPRPRRRSSTAPGRVGHSARSTSRASWAPFHSFSSSRTATSCGSSTRDASALGAVRNATARARDAARHDAERRVLLLLAHAAHVGDPRARARAASAPGCRTRTARAARAPRTARGRARRPGRPRRSRSSRHAGPPATSTDAACATNASRNASTCSRADVEPGRGAVAAEARRGAPTPPPARRAGRTPRCCGPTRGRSRRRARSARTAGGSARPSARRRSRSRPGASPRRRARRRAASGAARRARPRRRTAAASRCPGARG